MSTTYRFRWTCGFMNQTEYECWHNGQRYVLELRHGTSDYERSITNYSAADFELYVVGAIGVLRFVGALAFKAVPPELLHAFNAWRLAKHEQDWHEIDAQPERYGTRDLADPMRKPPVVVVGGHLELGKGWIVDTSDERIAA